MKKNRAIVTKAVVRNTERPKPKTEFVQYHVASSKQQNSKKEKENHPEREKSTTRETTDSKVRFKSPEPNSALILARKIESLNNLNLRKAKSASSLPMEKLAIDEKVTKHMNFPVDQPIYRNLIPLCTKPQSQPSLPTTRPPLPNKDEEPLLSDFYTPKRNCEYIYQPQIQNRQCSLVKDGDCLKLFQIMQTWYNY